MLHTSTSLTHTFSFPSKPGTTHRHELQWQHKRLVLSPLRCFACLVSLTLSACTAQLPPPASSAPVIEGGSQSQKIAINATDHAATPAADVFTRGQHALEAGNYEKAIALFNQAIQSDATNALYYLWLGRAYGHQAEQAQAGGQFFFARQVRKNLEKAVMLNPDLIEARLDLLTYYLQAPTLLGGGIEKAQAQAAEIIKRDPQQGALAWQQCQRAAKEGEAFFALSQ
jgi:tetratricopeptide (TPR) repeat protein